MKTSTPRLLSAFVLGWLLPGLGHVVYGRRGKALYFGGLILLTFAVGLWLGDARVVHAQKFPLYLLAQAWNGGPCLLALALTAGLRITSDIAYLDAGLLFTSVAGLLNIVVLVDVYEIHLRLAGRLPPRSPHAREAPGDARGAVGS